MSGCETPSGTAGEPSITYERPDAAEVQRSSFQRYLPGLDLTVEFVSELSPDGAAKYVVLPDGERVSPLLLQSFEASARYERFGAMEPGFATRLASVAPGDRVPIFVMFDLRLDWAARRPELDSESEPVRRRALRSVRQEIARQGAPVRTELETLGIANLRAATYMPVYFGAATPAQAHRVARLPSVTLVMSSERGTPRYASGGPTNTVVFHEMDTTFADAGFVGDGQRIGLLEIACMGLYDAHMSFDDAPPIVYHDPPIECADESDCLRCDNVLGDPFRGLCIDRLGVGVNECVWNHGSRVASVAFGTRHGVPGAAGKAELYFGNLGRDDGFGGQWVICDPEGLEIEYTWLNEEVDVRTVNESWGCFEPNQEGLIQDYFSRHYNFIITKGAGNNPLQQACPYSLNSLCVGAVDDSAAMSTGSARVNPGTDREEPDLVALGVDVDVMGFADVTDEDTGSGTSLAAPAMAAMIALLEECNGVEHLNSMLLRAILRTSSWPHNPHADRYSTPRPGFDARDGAGVPTGASVFQWCPDAGGEGPEVGSGVAALDPEASVPLEGSEEAETFPDVLGVGQERVGQELFRMELGQGERLRMTISWNSCPARPRERPRRMWGWTSTSCSSTGSRTSTSRPRSRTSTPTRAST